MKRVFTNYLIVRVHDDTMAYTHARFKVKKNGDLSLYHENGGEVYFCKGSWFGYVASSGTRPVISDVKRKKS